MRLARPRHFTHRGQQVADILMRVRQALLELRDAGVGVRQLLLDGQRLAMGLERTGRVARLRQDDADVVVASRQFDLELGDAGVGIGQFLLDGQCLAAWPPAPRPGRPSATASRRCCCGSSPRPAGSSAMPGLASASFCWMASAWPKQFRAATGSPVCDEQGADVVVAHRHVPLELDDKWVGVGLLLLDGERLVVAPPAPGQVARRGQQVAQVVEALSPVLAGTE